LCESEQHFRTIANSGAALIWTLGTDKLCNYFNEPWLKFTGRTLQQELGNATPASSLLLVDDKPINREVTLIQLEDLDLLIDTAEDGEKAVAMARKTCYAAIFVDMQMPKLNGVEATQQIRQIPGYLPKRRWRKGDRRGNKAIRLADTAFRQAPVRAGLLCDPIGSVETSLSRFMKHICTVVRKGVSLKMDRSIWIE
jgi:CheY-like chemotaxis protein